MRSGPGLASPSFRSLLEQREEKLSIQRDFGTDNPLYDQIVKIRSDEQGQRSEFGFDRYSYHYALFVDDRPVGTMTATRLADGKIDCEEAYPQKLLRTFRDEIYSTCKFRIHRSRCSSMKTLRAMVRAVWQDQLSLASRLVLINAETTLVPFYRRMGFHVIEGSDFVHPALGTESVALMMPADPNRRSFFSDLFDDLEDPLWMDVVQAACDFDNAEHSSTIQHLTLPAISAISSRTQGTIQ
ncbi:N-acyl amino acid synthase FeeM domain-containing protein [Rhodopirellula sallentina]|uniref:N-acyl amino acid synthase FeeM catalytic core domain-containing protein n=1 Tax=Rhodopirellula sallentina SM41 TaxID=1263870 RepID=M5U372_9BACT|nr:hypothetical protein [Rhodopirellula sallentina]EMI55912.1 hypothetical protein RSSM_02652 [Rhodopirellula sallentina SM41]